MVSVDTSYRDEEMLQTRPCGLTGRAQQSERQGQHETSHNPCKGLAFLIVVMGEERTFIIGGYPTGG